MNFKRLRQTFRLLWDYYVHEPNHSWLKTYFQVIRCYLKNKRQKIDVAESHGRALKHQATCEHSRQKECNHLKGGTAEYITGKGFTGRVSQGSSPNEYAIIRHQFPWGDIWVRCIRCGKQWKPGNPEYEDALKFPTSNVMSTSIQLRGLDIQEARKLTENA